MKNKLSKTLSISLASVALLSNFAYADSSNTTTNDLSNKTELSENAISSKATSSPVSFSGSGKNYKGYTNSYISAGRAYGESIVESKSGFVPTGYMGAHVNLYNDKGVVVAPGSWFYNPNSVSLKITNLVSTSQKGTFHARGTGRAYNGNTYNSKRLNNSPNVILRDLNISIPNEELKEREYLYETKNMIPALGDSNVEGYVIESELYDLENQPNNPEEAIAYMNKMARIKQRSIPLYANDGETIIDQLTINCQPQGFAE